MKVKQLVELLSQFDPESTVQVAYPATDNYGGVYRETAGDLLIEEICREGEMNPLISVGGAHLLEN